MNKLQANKLRAMAREAVNKSVPEKTSPVAKTRLAEKLYQSLRRHWMRLNHRERGRFSVRDAVAGLQALR